MLGIGVHDIIRRAAQLEGNAKWPLRNEVCEPFARPIPLRTFLCKYPKQSILGYRLAIARKRYLKCVRLASDVRSLEIRCESSSKLKRIFAPTKCHKLPTLSAAQHNVWFFRVTAKSTMYATTSFQTRSGPPTSKYACALLPRSAKSTLVEENDGRLCAHETCFPRLKLP